MKVFLEMLDSMIMAKLLFIVLKGFAKCSEVVIVSLV
jgi:hypothetical protein